MSDSQKIGPNAWSNFIERGRVEAAIQRRIASNERPARS